LREAEEEMGVPAHAVSVFTTFSDDHGSWRYDTVIAMASRHSFTTVHNRETDDAQWVPIEKVDQLPLHFAFARAWPTLRELIGA
jgi:8-oxo-dGTP diphosphatase